MCTENTYEMNGAIGVLKVIGGGLDGIAYFPIHKLEAVRKLKWYVNKNEDKEILIKSNNGIRLINLLHRVPNISKKNNIYIFNFMGKDKFKINKCASKNKKKIVEQQAINKLEQILGV